MSTWKAVLTEKGEALLAKMTQGSALTITHAEVGAGTVDASLLKQQTSVATMKQRATIEPVGYPAEGMCALPVTITNEGLSAGYSAWQIGIFANDPDEGTVLFFIAQAEDLATGVPSAALMPSYKTQIIFHVEYGDADVVNVDVNPANVVSQAAMENYVNAKVGTAKEDITAHTANKQNPHGVTADQIGAAKATHKHSASDINSGTLALARLPKDDLVSLHVWGKYDGEGVLETVYGTVNISSLVGNAYSDIPYSTQVDFTGEKVTLVNPIMITNVGPAGTNESSIAATLAGKYVEALDGNVYLCKEDMSTSHISFSTSNTLHITMMKRVNAPERIGFVAATERDAYPTSGTHTDGYWYEYQKQLGEAPTPAFTYGTKDLEAGVSSLASGKLYFVYE